MLAVGSASSTEVDYKADIDHSDIITLAQQLLVEPDSDLKLNSQTLPSDIVDINRIIDAVQETEFVVASSLISSPDFQDNKYGKYFRAFSEAIKLPTENIKTNPSYLVLENSLKDERWDRRHVGALLLSTLHHRANNFLECLKHAENALEAIPNESGIFYDHARFSAQYTLHVAFALDGDVNGVVSVSYTHLTLPTKA